MVLRFKWAAGTFVRLDGLLNPNQSGRYSPSESPECTGETDPGQVL